MRESPTMQNIYNQARRTPRIKAKSQERKHMPAIDGLKGLAILAVVAYHLKLPFMKSGLLGVTMLFVVSGFWITKILLDELESSNGINLLQFWKKRIFRLLPTLIAMIAIFTILFSIFNRVVLGKLRPDILPTIFFINNWWQIFHNVSYFEALGSPSPLTHCWSLAIEEQFYILWPIGLLLLNKFAKDKKMTLWVMIGLTAISVLLMAILFNPAKDPSRAYYGTDTRMFSLFAGGILAFLVRDPEKYNWQLPAIGAEIMGGVALLLSILMMVRTDPYSSFLYRGGQVLISAFTVAILIALFRRNKIFTRILSFEPLVKIGEISYSLYIWHYPILILFAGGKKPAWWLAIIIIILSFVVSILAYKFIEKPMREGIIGKTYRTIEGNPTTSSARLKQREILKRTRTVLMAVLIVAIASGCCLAFVPAKDAVTNLSEMKETESVNTAQEEGETTEEPSEDVTEPTEEETTEEVVQEEPVVLADVSQINALLLGDSVAIGAMDTLKEDFPHMVIDAEIGRYSSAAAPLYQEHTDQGWKGDCVIYSLASNGPIYDGLETLREAMGPDMPLLVINSRAPYTEWQDSNNKEIAAFVDKDPNCYLVDWYGASEGHGEYFYEDDTHLTIDGARAYCQELKKTMSEAFG